MARRGVVRGRCRGRAETYRRANITDVAGPRCICPERRRAGAGVGREERAARARRAGPLEHAPGRIEPLLVSNCNPHTRGMDMQNDIAP